jgi:hypothetical protein
MDKYGQNRRLANPKAPFDSEPLDLASVDALARRIADLLRDTPRGKVDRRLVDAATLAAELGVKRSWVYQHATELQPIRLGRGPKARLRFDTLVVHTTLAAKTLTELRSTQDGEPTTGRMPARLTRRRRSQKRIVGRVLAVRPRDAS